MNMRPIFSAEGRLQGHVDLLACPMGRDGVHISDTPAAGQDGASQSGAFRTHSIHTRSIKIASGEDRAELTFLVSDDIPDWVWETGRAVKFTGFRRGRN
jgi:hypothetical protein